MDRNERRLSQNYILRMQDFDKDLFGFNKDQEWRLSKAWVNRKCNNRWLFIRGIVHH